MHIKEWSKIITYIPAFLAAPTPEGASSNTRIFCESTGPPCSSTNFHELLTTSFDIDIKEPSKNIKLTEPTKDSMNNPRKLLSSVKHNGEHPLDNPTSNLLAAARNISGDGFPCLTSGSSPRTT